MKGQGVDEGGVVRGPELRLGLLREGGEVRTRRGLTLPVSLAAHGVVAAALIVLPLLGGESMPEPAHGVRAFLVEPALAPAPPPPPPPAPAAAAPRPAPVKPVAVTPVAFTAPIEVPAEVKPEPDAGLGLEGGVPGGVEGGVPGGVVGGVIGGLPEAPPPVQAPLRVGGQIKEPRKVRQVAPVYPEIAKAARVEGVVIIEAVVDEHGRVSSTNVLRSVPLLDEAALEAVRQWVYAPTLLNGVPKAVVMTVTVTFQLRRPAQA